jgi:hypothetical protein
LPPMTFGQSLWVFSRLPVFSETEAFAFISSTAWTSTIPGCSDNPSFIRPVRRAYGTGKFFRERVPKPPALKHIPRSYSRYGMSTQLFVEELQGRGKAFRNPRHFADDLLVPRSSGSVVRLAKEIHPSTPVLLGGIYAKLCMRTRPPGVRGRRGGDGQQALRRSCRRFLADPSANSASKAERPSAPVPHPYPSFDLLHGIDYVCLQTSCGCPFPVSLIVQALFSTPTFPEKILSRSWRKSCTGNRALRGVRDFAFYDDALLMGFEYALEGPARRGGETKRGASVFTRRTPSMSVKSPRLWPSFSLLPVFKPFASVSRHRTWVFTGNWTAKSQPGEFEKAVRNLTKPQVFPGNKSVFTSWQAFRTRSVASVEDSVRICRS